jgi:NAD(P) transhydrogenase subunit alpha
VPGEARVALVPEVVGKLRTAGYQIAVEPDAGRLALLPDEAYAAAGVAVTESALLEADVVVSVQPLAEAVLRSVPRGAATISFYPTAARAADLALRQERGLLTFGMEFVPRISRAQSMDALSSQSLVAGYRAAIVAAGGYGSSSR